MPANVNDQTSERLPDPPKKQCDVQHHNNRDVHVSEALAEDRLQDAHLPHDTAHQCGDEHNHPEENCHLEVATAAEHPVSALVLVLDQTFQVP